ncbi:CDP-glucose 4,6-dehydratase [Cellvibrio zantedeschiae]|uniref:CDP-glucose 4,6-dehydratase n=1 Tax=Cellvibrio zantedeschiae TaxID=1237077 RepID=A0ABQ3AQG0_9GAMM|nr:CDP-glucose 4,6-dehydratase [Cellvibrio zantedeschiae]GGY62955.1 CDP-glucose 4,6-dehydratase [Cellvibrio zantedeschiae]
MKNLINVKFWNGKKVFLTGHTGFKGSWLTLWLNALGAEVKGYALAPTDLCMYNEAKVSNYINSNLGDIRDLNTLEKIMRDFDPDIIFHLAAQPLVRLSYQDPLETYSTNIMGTLNVFEAARRCSNLKAIVNVTSDKCYENREWIWGYRENEPMGGHDPYSNSKACSELITSAYRSSFFNDAKGPAIASARAGNVIGGGDWSADRLIPDILRAFEQKIPVIVRNPKSTRPWQHVLEPLSGYLVLAQLLTEYGSTFAEGWNFGPDDKDVKPVEWIVEKMVAHWSDGASWKLDTGVQPHEAQSLKLDISKAKARLNWQPIWSLEETLKKIIDWQQAWLANEPMDTYSLVEIRNFMSSTESI